MQETEICNKKGFVFIDDKGNPFYCKIWENEPWVFCWHTHQQSWVSLKKVPKEYFDLAYKYKISDVEAEEYHKKHRKFIK